MKYITCFLHVAETDYTKLKKINDYFNDFQYAGMRFSQGIVQSRIKKQLFANVEELRTKLDPQRAPWKNWAGGYFPYRQRG